MSGDSRGSGDPADLGIAETEVSSGAGDTGGSAIGAVAPAVEVRGFRSIESGAVLDRYVIDAELGQGGMATVYRARDKELRRDVAIKILFPHLARKHEVVRRFSREARAAAALEHPHILRVYDVGGGELLGGDPPYIVMELVPAGESLRELAEHGVPLPAELVASMGAVLCDALAVAHRAGVIHRDVKPGNVLVAPGGRLLLADFGVARIEDDDASVVTRTGALLGTPSFMSPEQAQGQDVDGRSDLYSVGASLYQLATASLPFSGPTARVVAHIVRGELTPPLRRAPSMGPDLARAIEALMAVDPARRPAKASEAAAMLRAVAAAGGVDDVDAELTRFFADPAAYRAARPKEIAAVVVARARAALARRELPRAMALADRAAALAPDDDAVRALGLEVARGGRRRRWAAIVGGLVLVGGGGAAAVTMWPSGGRAPAAAAIDAAVATDAKLAVFDAPGAFDAGVMVPRIDAPAPPQRIDGGPRPRVLVVLDASMPDGAPVPPSPPDAAAPPDGPPRVVPAHVTFAMDAWCDVTIDGTSYGRADRARAIELSPGHHEVACSQGKGLPSWSGAIELAGGEDHVVKEKLLAKVAVTIEIDARIDGVPHRKGDVVELAPGRHRVDLGGGAGSWFSVTHDAPCHLRDSPDLDCYP